VGIVDEEQRLTVPGVLEEVARVCAFVVEAAEAAGLDERAVYHCQMAVDEWCTNVIEHGYTKAAAANKVPGRIEIDLRIESGKLLIIVADDSPRFDPTQLIAPRTDQSVDEREPGGLGWFLIKKIMDDVQYDYVDGHNRLQMTKRAAAENMPTRPAPVTFPSYELRGQIWVISPNGRLDSTGGLLLEATLAAHFSENHLFIIVDMHDVPYISSGGLKALLGAFKKVRGRGGELALAAMTVRVQEVFQISGFESLFRIAPTVQQAAAGFTASTTTVTT
jgi:anti-anti-sigma factor